MGYPVSYRSGARKYAGGGFQNPTVVPPGRRPGRPANDNWPTPANDNDPGAGVRPPKVEVPSNPFPGLALDFGYGAMRAALPPPVRLAWDAYDLVNDAYGVYRNRALAGQVDLGGWWSVVCGPSYPIQGTGRFGWWGGLAGTCGLAGQALGNVLNSPLEAKVLNSGWLYVKGNADNSRWYIIQSWKRNSPGPGNTSPYYRGPTINGQASAFAKFQPEPMPWSVANPLPAYVPNPVGNELPASKAMPAQAPRSRPGLNPYARPSRSLVPGKVTISPPPGTVVVTPPQVVLDPIRVPPGRGVKERKVRASGAFAGLNGALGVAAGIYEDAKFYNDVLNAFYYALPGKHGAKTPAEKALAIYRGADKLDINKAVLGVLIAVAGEKAGAYIDRARRYAGDQLGVGMYIDIPTGSAPRL